MAKKHNRHRDTQREGGFLRSIPHRNIKELHPEMTAAEMAELTTGSLNDKIGSITGRRGESLRGAPDISWYSLGGTDSVIPVTTIVHESEGIVYLQGYNFLYTTGIYLSASDPDMFTTVPQTYDLFSTYTNRLTAEYPEFTAVPVSEWSITNNTNMYFTLSAPQTMGDIDIIIAGPAGYAKTSSSIYTESQSGNELINVTVSNDVPLIGSVINGPIEGTV